MLEVVWAVLGWGGLFLTTVGYFGLLFQMFQINKWLLAPAILFPPSTAVLGLIHWSSCGKFWLLMTGGFLVFAIAFLLQGYFSH